MSSKSLLFCLICCIILAEIKCQKNSLTSVQIDLPDGQNVRLIGEELQESSLNRPIHRFLGVPYARPPIGKLRFRRPQPWQPESTNEGHTVLNANKWPANCVQFSGPASVGLSKVEKYLDKLNDIAAEDCLYLNVWAPVSKNEAEDKLRPVLVFFYGGALYFGGTAFELYNGETLAAHLDAVIVTVNYRVSTLGFLYSSSHPEIRGNQGLWDQTLALKWIQQNIRAFGGDPTQVTISGESAGSWSVSAHVLSPASEGLFSRAILLSGAVMDIQEPEEYERKLLNGIRKVGCAQDKDETIDEKVVECLERMDPLAVYQIMFISMGDFLGSILVKDGEFFPDTPRSLISSKNYLKPNLSLLVSTVEDEGAFVLLTTRNDSRFLRQSPAEMSMAETQEYLLGLLEKKYKSKAFSEEAVKKVYYAGLSPILNGANGEFKQRISVAYGDIILTCPTLEFAKKLFQAAPESTQIYQWYYRAKLGLPEKWLCASWLGTCHTDDLFPFFGVPFRFPELFHNRERDISAEVMSFVGEFMRTGKPGPTQSEWEPYFQVNSKAGSVVIAPYYEIGNEHKTSESFKFNLKQLECEMVFADL